MMKSIKYVSLLLLFLLLNYNDSFSSQNKDIIWLNEKYVKILTNKSSCNNSILIEPCPISRIHEKGKEIRIGTLNSDPLPIEYRKKGNNYFLKQVPFSSDIKNKGRYEKYDDAKFVLEKKEGKLFIYIFSQEGIIDTFRFTSNIKDDIKISFDNITKYDFSNKYLLYDSTNKLIDTLFEIYFENKIKSNLFMNYKIVREWAEGKYLNNTIKVTIIELTTINGKSEHYALQIDDNCNCKIYSYEGTDINPKSLKLNYTLIREKIE